MAARLVRQQYTFHALGGKRVKPGTPGAEVVRKESSKWYAEGVPGHPPAKRIPLAGNRRVAERMLADLVDRAERGQVGLPARDAGRKPLADYLAEFGADLSLGLACRSRKNRRRPDPGQVALTVQRVRRVLDGCRFAYPADLTEAAPAKLAKYLAGLTALPRGEGGVSHQTADFYLAAARRFAWWLSARARAPVRADLFDDVPAFDPKNNRVHARRDVSPEELARVLEAARSGPVRYRLAGEDRYFLYLVAFATGFRARELAALAPESFDLDAPAVALPGRRAKNRKAVAFQPLPPGVAAQLRPFLAGKPAGVPVWPGKWAEQKRGAEILRHDLAAAGVPYRVDGPDGPQFADFHALRHSFVTALAAANVGPKEMQVLARHSTPALTLGVYAHARPAALAAAAALLPVPGAAGGNPLARLTRAELEDAVVGLAAALAVVAGVGLLTAPLTATRCPAADSAEPARPPAARRRSA